MSTTRPWVDAFADEMEAKLAENRYKGDREGWAKMRSGWLLKRLRAEVDELSQACRRNRGASPLANERVRREAADVANFAMMIADVAGGLRAKAAHDAKGAQE